MDIGTYIIAFGSAAAGALVGSVSTYSLGLRKQNQDENNRRHGALITTQFALFAQWKVVDGIRVNFLEPLKDEKDRFTKLRATFFIKAPLTVPLNEVAFIASSNHPNLIQEIADAEYGYLKSMQALDLFNLYRSEFEKNHLPIPGTLNKDKPSGQIVASQLDLATGEYYVTNLYKQVELASPKMRQTIDDISSFIKQNYKGKKAIKIEPEPTIGIAGGGRK